MLIQAGVRVLGIWVGRVSLPASLEIQEGKDIFRVYRGSSQLSVLSFLDILAIHLQNVWFWPLAIQNRGQCDPFLHRGVPIPGGDMSGVLSIMDTEKTKAIQRHSPASLH